MAMKWVAQIPQPPTAASSASHARRLDPCEALARWNRLIAAQLARKQMTHASATSRQSCSVHKQVNTLYMIRPTPPIGLTSAEPLYDQVNANRFVQTMVNNCFERSTKFDRLSYQPLPFVRRSIPCQLKL
jgi:hypothetical protein